MILILCVVAGTLSVMLLKSFDNPYLHSLFGGVAIMSSGYLLSVAVESAQKDISRSLATVILAILAILPEYAVDLYLAYMGGKEPSFVHYATANMTGANRMLLGLFWPTAALSAIYFSKSTKTIKGKAIILGKGFRLELFFLLVATFYSFKLPVMGRIDLIDCAFLTLLFLVYAYTSARSEEREEEFEGVVKFITDRKEIIRIPLVILLFIVAGVFIFLSVKPFVHGLIETGKSLGINQYLLIQWVAPVASEFPELVVSIILALKGKTTTAIGALVSSKINQWTLLVGMLPVAYSLGASKISNMPLDYFQREEVFLTAAQSLFGSILIADLRLSRSDALWLFLLFVFQFVVPIPKVRLILGFVYILLSFYLVIRDRARLYQVLAFYRNLLP